MLKVMSKMGISTYQSYCGAQIFDAVGLSSAFVDAYFTKTATMIEGLGLAEIAKETVRRHAGAFGPDPVLANALDVGGEYAFRLTVTDSYGSSASDEATVKIHAEPNASPQAIINVTAKE